MEIGMAFISIVAIVAIVLVAGGLIAFIGHMVIGVFDGNKKPAKQDQKEVIDYAQYKQLEDAKQQVYTSDYNFEAINESKAHKEREMAQSEKDTIFDIKDDKDDELEEIEKRLKESMDEEVKEVAEPTKEGSNKTEDALEDLDADFDLDGMLSEISDEVIEQEKSEAGSEVQIDESLSKYDINNLNFEEESEEEEDLINLIDGEEEEDILDEEQDQEVEEQLEEDKESSANSYSDVIPELQIIKEQLAELKAQMQEAKEVKTTNSEPIKERMYLLPDVNPEIERLQAQLAQLNAELEQAKKEKEEAIKEKEQSKSEGNAEIESLKAQLEELNDGLEEVKAAKEEMANIEDDDEEDDEALSIDEALAEDLIEDLDIDEAIEDIEDEGVDNQEDDESFIEEEITEERISVLPEPNSEIERLKAELAELNKQLEEARTAKVEVVRIDITEEECVQKIEILEERLKNVKKDYKINMKEYRPLKKVMTDLERYQTKLRRKEAVVAKKKVALYGVNNYVDIDKDKAEKLANELELLDGLRLSVSHCEEVINANKDRFPILEHTNQILEDQIANLEADLLSAQETLKKIREKNGNSGNSEE